MTGRNPLGDALGARVAQDPVTAALAGVVETSVSAVLARHVPRMAYTTAEVAEMLACSSSTVLDLVHAGKLRRVAGPQSTISLGSILELIEWPMQEAPVSAPLTAVPSLPDGEAS